jgi:hypothetical protein
MPKVLRDFCRYEMDDAVFSVGCGHKKFYNFCGFMLATRYAIVHHIYRL